MDLLSRFHKYLEEACHTSPNEKIIVAVSGGADSMCMLHLFIKSNIDIAIAHCNFQLRGEESDNEENFVKQVAEKYSIPVFIKKFKTTEYASLQKITIQEAARELRYRWFDNLSKIHSYDKIAIAHNADDSIETFFINILRGTGIQGLCGIKPENGNVIRPLLFAFRDEIEQYCKVQNIDYCTDSSNLTDKYLRNNIRHNIIPLFEKIKPDFRNIMLKNIDYLSQTFNIYENAIKDISKKILQSNDDYDTIDINTLLILPSSKTILFEILKKYGFSSNTCNEIYNCIFAESGKQFYSDTHRLIKDRTNFIISKNSQESEQKYYISDITTVISEPLNLTFSIKDNANYEIPRVPNIAALDYEKLQFPLIIRKWQNGDYFQPLGMKYFKKLSDFFVDKKFSLIEKERTWILTSGSDIVWVINHRIDERFKITETTGKILEIKVLE